MVWVYVNNPYGATVLCAHSGFRIINLSSFRWAPLCASSGMASRVRIYDQYKASQCMFLGHLINHGTKFCIHLIHRDYNVLMLNMLKGFLTWCRCDFIAVRWFINQYTNRTTSVSRRQPTLSAVATRRCLFTIRSLINSFVWGKSKIFLATPIATSIETCLPIHKKSKCNLTRARFIDSWCFVCMFICSRWHSSKSCLDSCQRNPLSFGD